MFLANISQGDEMSTEMFDLLSKSSIARIDEKESIVEICPRDELGVHFLKGNLGNSMFEISRYFERYHNIKQVEVKNPSRGGNASDGVVSELEKNMTKDVFLGYLNSKYTFDSFVVGESNNFANAAALGCVKNPGQHNPLFVRGASGLGKTHLMNAIGNEFLKRHPNLKICCISSEDFTNLVVEHIRNRNTALMRKKLRSSCDLLMIDDIQFIEGKRSTLEEFFHTFNALYDSGKQIVVTSDKVPEEMENFEERITSRFMWGLIADIRPPDIETRTAILTKKAKERNVEIPEGVVEFISEKVHKNVRELEGVLTKLVILAEVWGKPIDIRTAHQVIDDREDIIYMSKSRADGGNRKEDISIEIIKATVETVFNLTKGQIESQKRTRTITFPRQIAMFLIKKHLHMPYISIGEVFGNRDHSTVMYAVSKIEKNISMEDNVTVSAIKEIEDRMRA